MSQSELADAERDIDILTVALVSIIRNPHLPAANIARAALSEVYAEDEITDYVPDGTGRVKKSRKKVPIWDLER